MLEDMVHPHPLSIEEISSSLGAQILEVCESELFPETLQNSEVASTSNCCYEDHSYNQAHFPDMTNFNEMKPPPLSATATSPSPSSPTSTAAAATRDSHLSAIFNHDQLVNDISASIDFNPSPSFSHHCYIDSNYQESFDVASINDQISLGDMVTASSSLQYGHNQRWPAVAPQPPMVPILGRPLPEDECIPSYIPSQSGINEHMVAPFSAESSGMFTGIDLSHQDLDFEGDNGALFLPDHTMPRINFSCSNELQGLSSESQHLVHQGVTSNNNSATALASEISSLEDPTFKVGKLSVEERKKKIHRYLKKRNERNFSKKIKYACRKTLADSRPRVRGRFAKNDEFGEIIGRSMGSNREDETDEDVTHFPNSMADHQRKVSVKDEDDMNSTEILAQISGVNSFKCNYPIQSWI